MIVFLAYLVVVVYGYPSHHMPRRPRGYLEETTILFFFFIEFFVVRVCVQKPRAAPLCRVIIKGDLLKRHSDASDGLGSRSKRRAVRTHLPRSLVGTHCIAL